MKYVLGIDAGGTKYRVCALGMGGETLAEHTGECCSHYLFGREGAKERIARNLDACLSRFQGRREDCVSVVCGAANCDCPADEDILTGIYRGLFGPECAVLCLNDGELAFRVTVRGEGILVLAGTGSIALGQRGSGPVRRVGGLTKAVFNDEGSGRYIDALALQYYGRFLDGCRPYDPLIDEIRAVVGGNDVQALLDYADKTCQPGFSSSNLVPHVNRAAERGNPYAVDILKNAAGQLSLLAFDMLSLLGFQPDEDIRVGLWGGVVLSCALLREELGRLIRERYPRAVLVLPTASAVNGAAQLALQRCQGR